MKLPVVVLFAVCIPVQASVTFMNPCFMSMENLTREELHIATNEFIKAMEERGHIINLDKAYERFDRACMRGTTSHFYDALWEALVVDTR